MNLDETHDPKLTSWVESANRPDSAFPIQNLPYCVFTTADNPSPRAGVGIGGCILDIRRFLDADTLNPLMALPKSQRVDLRRRISRLLADPALRCEVIPQAVATLWLPSRIRGYTDFYASIHHATRVGSLFRPDNPLLPNYKHVPIAYHGRASSIVISGTAIRRPAGQITGAPEGPPRFAPSGKLDYELELGVFVGPGNAFGQPIPAREAADHLFGVTLLNDWSARDIQRWEYQPLGPFLAKNFATSISPWVVTTEALEPFRRPPKPRPEGDPQPLPYLVSNTESALDLTLEVWIQRAGSAQPQRVSRASFLDMYWTFGQMLVHHASNGCPMEPGDLLGSGTVSGPEIGQGGCLLELGQPFLEDGDRVILRGYGESSEARRIDLADCEGVVAAAAT
jgi:fumarylacetoacetase